MYRNLCDGHRAVRYPQARLPEHAGHWRSPFCSGGNTYRHHRPWCAHLAGRAKSAVRRPGLLQRPRASAFAATALVTALSLAGCHIPGVAGPQGWTGPLELTTITVGGLPVVDDAPLYLGAENGLFRREGLNVVVKTFGSSAAELQALASGAISAAAGSDIVFLQAQASGWASLRMIADGYEAAPSVMEVLVLPNSGITTPQQLANTIIGVPPTEVGTSSWIKNMEELTTGAVLQNNNVDPTSIQWRQRPAQDMINALKRGQVRAIVATEPYITDAERSLGAIEVLDSCSGAVANMPLTGYFSLASFARQDPNTLHAFARGLDQAQAAAAERSAVQDVLPSYTRIDRPTASLITLGVYPTSLNADRVQLLADLMFQSGVISRPITVPPMVLP
jgi:NitT/TauT family transport system substrate-binding protein